MKTSAIPVLLAGISLWMFSACSPSEGAAPPAKDSELITDISSTVIPQSVRILSVGQAEFESATQTISGTVISDQMAQPSSLTGGVLSQVLINEGDDVRRGQVIARLESTELQAAQAQARVGLAKAERDLARVEKLFADSVATRTQRDDAATGLSLAREQLKSIEYKLAQSTITAPISGRVMRKLANAGETIGPGMPVAIIQGTSDSDWRVRAGLTDAQWAATRVGQEASLRFDAYPGKQFRARLVERATAADPASGTFPVEFQLLQQVPSLAAGLIAEVRLSSPQQADGKSIRIPMSALGRVAGKKAEVFLAHNGSSIQREVQLGSIRGESVEILDGLSPGDSLIITGVAWLRDGDSITITE